MPTVNQLAFEIAAENIELSEETLREPLPLNHYYSHAGLGKITQWPLSLYYRASAFGNSSHRHGDQGNIAFFDKDIGVLVPTGSYGYRFGSQHHQQWTRQTIAHNLPLVGGHGQRLDHQDAVGRVLYRQTESNYHVVTLDLSDSYERALEPFYRTLVLVAGYGLIVADTIVSGEDKALNWRLHSSLDAALTSDNTTLLTHPDKQLSQYKCHLLSHPDVPSTRVRGYSDELTLPKTEIESDASKQVVHLDWQLPESRRHDVIACCVRQDMPFPEAAYDRNAAKGEAAIELKVLQQIIRISGVE